MLNNKEWFTEFYPNFGTGFGLQIKSKLHEEKSPFQTIAIYETTHFGNLMTIDSIIMLSSRDNFMYHEMMSHPILFTHPNPKNIVIIGGGDCGTLKEVLKHPVDSVTQIDIDERVTRLSEIYFPELCTANHDKRASLLFQDGIRWMIEAPTNSVDVIIVDSTDPIGPAEGLFNQAFYSQCHRVLRDNGILVQQSESPILHQAITRDMRNAMQKAAFSEVLTITYPQPVYPSGWHSATLAGKKAPLKTFRRDDALLKSLQTQYYHFDLHQGLLTEPAFLQRAFS
ncbi:MAG: polyamine aminopropyltransferase [Proteobacteria bacterium]|nr:polyamine aminopropyltransferase [Pseudomonadota bacterium]